MRPRTWASWWSPSPHLLSRTERLEGALWRRKAVYALFGWLPFLFPERVRPTDDVDDVLALMKVLVAAAIVIGALKVFFG